MKKILNIKYLALALTLAFFSCESDDKVIDQVFDGVDTETPFLRILNQSGSNLDIFNTSSMHTWELEYQLVPNDPSLEKLQSVDFQVSFIDNNDEDGVDRSAGPAAFGSLGPADFDTEGDFGNMKASFSYSLQEAMDAVGVTVDDLSGGDNFLVTWEMTTTDGDVIGPDDVSGDVAAVGGYYSSQYQLIASLVCDFDRPDFFTGDYLLEQLDLGADPFFPSFGDTFATQTVTLSGSGTSRTFDFTYYPTSFAIGSTMTLNFVCDRVFISGENIGLSCDGGATSINQSNSDNTITYFDNTDFTSDEIILYVEDFDPDGGCDTGTYDVRLRLTKL